MGEDSQGAQRLVADRYRLTAILGQGAMGIVWRAADELIGRAVAVKELRTPPGLSAEERSMFRERALREARAAGRLNHPNIVAIHDLVPAIHEDDAVYIVMELVEAPSLEEVLERYRALPEQRVARMAVQVLGALDAAHSIGLVHRDIKPGNIMVLPGDEVKLVDFGIAHAMDDTRLTRHGVAGSTGYIAPELFEGADPSPAADLWSLGATLFHAVEGRDPFSRESTAATLRAILHADLPPLSCHPPLSTLIAGLLTRDTAHRMTSRQAGDLLRSTTNAAPPAAAPTGPGRTTRRSDPIAVRPTPSPTTPSAPTPTGSGDATWQSHPTTVNPVVVAPYAVPRNKWIRIFKHCARLAVLVSHGGAVWWAGSLFGPAGVAAASPIFLLNFIMMQSLISPGWWDRIDMADDGIIFSSSKGLAWRLRSRKACRESWDRIDEVTISGITQAGPENSGDVRTRVFLRTRPDASNDDRARALQQPWPLADISAPADTIETAFRIAAPPSVRITRAADMDARTRPVPGLWRYYRLLLVGTLIFGLVVMGMASFAR